MASAAARCQRARCRRARCRARCDRRARPL